MPITKMGIASSAVKPRRREQAQSGHYHLAPIAENRTERRPVFVDLAQPRPEPTEQRERDSRDLVNGNRNEQSNADKYRCHSIQAAGVETNHKRGFAGNGGFDGARPTSTTHAMNKHLKTVDSYFYPLDHNSSYSDYHTPI
ncbi:MAG: hypothetical protein ACRCYZ_02885 [Alphaproteobacteria bacterium]